ncbi:MAG: hypothetical protein ABI183_03630 [Polyangiaceae bacterium]
MVVLGAVALAVPAVAQTSASPTASSAAAPLATYPACSMPPSKDDSEVAHGAYIAGKRAFDENDYPTALQYFRDALKRDCTKYELLNIISRAYELEGNRPEAINALQVYLKRAPANDPGAEAIQRRVVNLKALQDAADASAKAAATSGSASASATTTASAQPSTTSTSEPPPELPVRGHTVAPWILMGAGVVAIGVGIPLAIIGANNITTADNRITADGCEVGVELCPGVNANSLDAADQANGPRNNGSIEEGIGIGLIGVGAAAIVGGLVWHFVEPTGPADTSQKAKLTVRPDSRPGYQGLSVLGTF